ncbi:MAG: hypothetical protein RLZZ626_172 [Actinomycetota bacterium]
MSSLHPGRPRLRLRVFSAFILVVGIIFGWRLIDFQVVNAKAINDVSYANRSITRVLPAIRGEIVDNGGNVLAQTILRYDVNAAPNIVTDYTVKENGQDVTVTVDQAAGEIASLLKMSKAKVLAKLVGTSKYSNIAKRVDASVYRQLQALNVPWLFYDAIPSRVYPNGAVAGNIIGFVGQDAVPLAGLELTSNDCLHGVDGQETYEKGAVDGIRIPSSAIVSKAPRNGSNVVLTINSALQYYAQQVMLNYVASEQAQWGTAVVVEVKTGNILAAAEAPSVDPNKPGAVRPANRGARIFQTAFEPGSTMKAITASIAVDTGKATPATRVVAPFRIILPFGGYIQDSELHQPEKLTLTGVLRDSSNTGIIQIGGKVPRATRFKYLKKFGFGSRTTVGFEGESSGLLRDPDTWDKMTDKVSMFGQGVGVTPIQMAMAFQTIANGGVRLEPRLVAGCKDASGKFTPTPVAAGTKVIKPATAASVINMLEKVVEHGGIGHTASVPGYRIGGKSGTAQVREPNGYYGIRHAISFIGLVPANDPQYVVAVTLFKPVTFSNSLGATPPFKAIMQQVLRTYRVPPSTTKSKWLPEQW